MESLGDILKRITVRNTSMITNGDGAVLQTGDLDRENAHPACPRCKDSGWLSKRVPVDHPDFGQAFPCQCQRMDDPAARTAALLRYSNLGSLARISLTTTRPEGPLPDAGSRRLFQQALATAAEFSENPVGWMALTGPSGSGKTHLAVAVANRCIERGQTTFFIVVADLLDHLRASFSPDNEVSYDELFDQVRQVPVLVLDDLGAQSATPWAQEKLFQVFNHRFNAALPTVITIRGPLQRLDEMLRSRIEAADGFCRVLQLGQYNTRLPRGIGDIPAKMRQRMTFDSFDVKGGRTATRTDRESLERAKQAAATFAAEPEVVLLDEPFGALDPLTRDRLQRSFQKIRRELGLTAIFVTHDMVEALLLGDRIAVLHHGRLVQVGKPEELLRVPADDYVRELMATPRRQAAIVDRFLGSESRDSETP